jgi:hypothetical protein
MNATTITTSLLAGPVPLSSEDIHRELVDHHARAGQLIAELSDGPAWADTATILGRLVAEAAAIAGRTDAPEAGDRPAVVRCRELAQAQRGMVVALDAGAIAGEDALIRSRALLAELGELADRTRATLRG